MTKETLCNALNYINASREKRSEMATTILSQPTLIPLLVQIMKDDMDPISCKASWVLEFVAKDDINHIYLVIEPFLDALPFLSLESSIRPASKICEMLVDNHYNGGQLDSKLTKAQINTIAEIAFDWLIGEHKVATKAYSMTILLLTGKTIIWIHEELEQILKQNYENGSAAYKARARMTLKSLKKLKNN
ncbi:adenylosuccinate lyase [Maribacter sp. LLG6340-A2]|uniref:adenylosuccinate lyase n=1 Tax=Maribacter sp. LLG6340-A2 TaxID=3160834 RepID=UPI003866435E